MSDVDTLREHANFQAARKIVVDLTSATDFHPINFTRSSDEGCTDHLGTWREAEQWPLSYPWMQIPAEGVSSIGSLSLEQQGEPTPFAGMSDFAVLDDLRTPEGQIQRQIHSVRRGFQLNYRERLARRLEFLLETMKEEGEAWTEDSPESLRRMLLFLNNVPSFRYPMVTTTPSSTFRAQWTADAKRHFAVDFLPNGQVYFVVFSPDPRHPNRVQRTSGITSLETLIDLVEPHRVQRWTADAGA